MRDLTIDRASFIALVIETLNIGISTMLSITTAQLIFKKTGSNLNRHLLATLGFIWVLCVAHWIIDILRASQAFIDSPEGAIAYYSIVSNRLEAAKDGVYITVTLVADHFMIYRLFVVWNRNWLIVILPILLWIGGAINGYTVTHMLLLAGDGNLFISTLAPWALTFFSMSLGLNVLCTILIAGRILWTDHQVRNLRLTSGPSYVQRAATVFIESAAMYSLSLTVLLVLYDLNLNSQYILLDWTTSIIGIVFSLVIYRSATTATTDTPSTLRQEASYPLTRINVTQFTQEDYDSERSTVTNNKEIEGHL
ncbi:hypothetical protein B0H16DRAFT_1896093 [Mycena metata]|uniref:Uncharacterized protein n=1 Tax=Mycena metata TaxID=1033252 RepID=A0AAD7MLE2_9AGAR|nr:hypothetical protein B0H16DRAFT_1896093 [Mycena metata]